MSQEKDEHEDLSWLLPQKMYDLAGMIGFRAVKLLIESYGGRRIHIPLRRNLKPDQGLSLLIGHEAARKLAGVFGGDYFAVPLASEFKLAVRNRAIVARRAEGVPVATIAREYGTTEKTVYYVLAQHKRRSAATLRPITEKHHAPSHTPD